MQLSAFFPFYRNHNVLKSISQEPYRWAAVADASRTAMGIRYSILPYLYTLMANAHYKGDTVMRALTWEFPEDPSLAAVDAQFMLGPAILVTPCLEQGANTTNGVFPGSGDGERWYDWYNQSAVAVDVGRRVNVSLDTPLGHIPVFARGGYVLPLQQPALTTAIGRRTPWGLLVALDQNLAAQGELYLDDGVSQTPNATTWVTVSPEKSQLHARVTPMLICVQFAAGNNSLVAQVRGNFTDTNALANVTVMGLTSTVFNVSLNCQALQASQWTFDPTAKLLKVTRLNELTSTGAWASDWTLNWQ
jgi:alpha-glucosidase